MGNPFQIGQYVKYMPRHRSEGELYVIAESAGLWPRKIYSVTAIDGEYLVFSCGGKDHYTNFKNGELDHKLGKQDESWIEQKARMDASKENFEASHAVSKRWQNHRQT
jgi:hypothetical protein